MKNKRILWVHGWGMSPEIWRQDVLDRLPEYEHHFVNFEGCAVIEDLRQAVTSRLDHACGGWSVIGWSMGAMLSLEAFLDPQQSNIYGIEALAVVAGTLRFTDRDRHKGWPPRVVERMRKQLAVQPEDTLLQFKKLMASGGSSAPDLETALMLQPTDFTHQGLEAGLTYLLETDLRERWAHLSNRSAAKSQIPSHPRLLWIHGGQDAICPIGAVPDEAGAQTVVFEQSGHLPFLEEKRRFYQQIRSFLYAGH
jgi:pimeloyl-[acyl-carrier protein] methyl ester esterase